MGRPKKVEKFKLTAHTYRSGNRVWLISGTGQDGDRIRKFFPDKAEALRELNDIEAEEAGEPELRRALRTSFSPEELSDAEAAAEHAGSRKLTKIVSHYLSLLKRAESKGIDLDQAIAFAEARYRPETKSITIYNAIQAFLKSRVDLSENTISNYDRILSHLLQPDPNKTVHSFTIAEIEKVFSNYKNLNTRKTLRTIFSVFFNWAARHHYCLENPCERLDKLPKDTRKIVILSFDEVKRLLRAAIEYRDGAASAPIAISLFAGLRPSELAELQPADIRQDTIIVRGGKMRRSGNRRVPIPDVLKIWLKQFPFEGLPDGWSYKMKQLKAATKARHWVPDILRHTSISHQAERDKNEGETAFNCGTSKQMMDRHYRDLVEDDAALSEFWKLTPEKIRKVKLKVTLPATQKVAWPPKATLKKLVWQTPLVHAAKDIGVSDVALKKHCLKLGIELPPRGHWLKDQRQR